MLEPQNPDLLLRRVRDLLLLTVFALVALLFSGQHTTTTYSKTTSFYILIWLALLVEFILILRSGWNVRRAWWPVLVCLGALFLWCLFSTEVVAPIPRSHRELTRRLALLCLVVVSIGAGRSAWFRRQFLGFGTLLPFVIAVYACVQSLGWDFFKWPEFEWGGEFQRVVGTLGNPDFLAGFFVGTIPLGIAYSCLNEERWQKIFGTISVILQFVAVILTLSRGVWIGFVFAGLALLVVLPNRTQTFKRTLRLVKRPSVAVPMILGAIVAVTVLWPAISSLGSRLSSASFAGRKFFYVSCLRLAARHPVTGIGLDAFPVYFPQVRDPRLSEVLPFRKWYVEHAHSEPLEILVNLGIVGFLLWAGVFLFWALALVPRIREMDRGRAVLVGACWVGVIGILGHNLVTVTLRHTSSSVLLWMLLGVSIGTADPLTLKERARRRGYWWLIIGVLLIVSSVGVWWQGSRAYQADRYLRSAKNVIDQAIPERFRTRKTQMCHTVLDLLSRAERLTSVSKESLYWRAWAYYELGDCESARREYERTIRLEGPFVDTVPNIGKVLMTQGSKYLEYGFPMHGLRAYAESLQWWQWACEMEPERAEHWRSRAGALGMLGRIEDARAAFERALEFEKDPAEKERTLALRQQLERDAEALSEQAERFLKPPNLQ